jgi:hypothetical protein
MDIQLLNIYRQAEEISTDSNYGYAFFLKINDCYEKQAISLFDLNSLVSCLINIDETRDCFHDEIKHLIFFVLQIMNVYAN